MEEKTQKQLKQQTRHHLYFQFIFLQDYDEVNENRKPRFHYHQITEYYALRELEKLRPKGALKNSI